MMDRRGQLVCAAAAEASDEEDVADQNVSADEEEVDVAAPKKIGAKKLAKLQRKEEARQYRQVIV